MTRPVAAIVLFALVTVVSGCGFVGTSVNVTGPDLVYSDPDYKLPGKVTLVELSTDGFEQSRTSVPASVFEGLGMSESAIASASVDEEENPFAASDYMRFAGKEAFLKGEYPAGRSGRRRLEFEFSSPAKRCKTMTYKLQIEWSWRNNRVTRSRIFGDWKPSDQNDCIPGLLRAETIGRTDATRRRVGSVQYNSFIEFHAPLEDLDSGKIVEPASADANYYFGGALVTVRGDGRARYSGTMGAPMD